ncbi:MAG TPA: NAD(P)H-dependent oxidoreductase [Myxococcota bacterium]|nr:NAD(P)H-dependent oxidoreductase [Myxococcota bacterium]HRY92164.1 NAD(P)H-dependent oxidoreductase [Myxococcota bacterium]HSA20644.1 NAD(P)H-dependent oxidoreductase [Myxococcota bacterium]
MRVLVLNGSPKGEQSVSLQYVRYLARRLPAHNLDFFHVSKEIRGLERDPSARSALLARLGEADLVLWCTPVYYFLVPSQLKRLVELLFAAGPPEALRGRYATALTTSIHFFDHAAHEYLHAVSEDLGLRFLPGYSAGMDDLLKAGARRSLEGWLDAALRSVAQRAPQPRRFAPLSPPALVHRPAVPAPAARADTRRVTLVTDAGPDSPHVESMQRVLSDALPCRVEELRLRELELKGCLGCLRCAWNGECVHRDGFGELYRQKVLGADALVFAGAVRDRYLSARFKAFFDRTFFLGHQPLLEGKQVLWLISGPLQQLGGLRQILEAYTQLQKAHLVGVVTDEVATSAELDALLAQAARDLVQALDRGLRTPRLFPAHAGTKLFRDFVYLTSALFQADHRHYRAHGIYDFPQDAWGARLRNGLAGLAMRLPPVRRRVLGKMRTLMLGPYLKVVEHAPRG